MIKVDYGDQNHIDALKKSYLAIYDHLGLMQREWVILRKKLITVKVGLKRVLPTKIDNILVADFKTLVDIYDVYISAPAVDTSLEDELKCLFRYAAYNHITGYQPKISSFFMNTENGFRIHTCHYCDMTYINTYGLGTLYQDKLDFLNYASVSELTKWLECAESTARKVIERREDKLFDDLNDFDTRGWKWSQEKSSRINIFSDNHYDLDHVLDKGKCPIIALSLFNLVPSCQVCNEKLKRSQVLGSNDKPKMNKLSPTSPDYSFDEKVSINVINKRNSCSTFGFMRRLNDYQIEFNTLKDADYEEEIKLFNLTERYNFHKAEALRLMDLKERYTDTRILELGRLIQGNSETENISKKGIDIAAQIKEDIFASGFRGDSHRCFGKLYNDIMGTTEESNL